GCARALRQAVSRLRPPRAAYRPRRERDELLRPLPDGGQAHGRPCPLAPLPGRLASHARGAGGAPAGKRGVGLSLAVKWFESLTPQLGPAPASTAPRRAAPLPAVPAT